MLTERTQHTDDAPKSAHKNLRHLISSYLKNIYIHIYMYIYIYIYQQMKCYKPWLLAWIPQPLYATAHSELQEPVSLLCKAYSTAASSNPRTCMQRSSITSAHSFTGSFKIISHHRLASTPSPWRGTTSMIYHLLKTQAFISTQILERCIS